MEQFMGVNFGVFSLLESSKCVPASTYNGECVALTLGKLKIFFTEKQKIYSSEKYGIPLGVFSGYAENVLNAIGCTSVTSLDYSDYEGADYVWNLNTSVNSSEKVSQLISKYDLILDYGTTEHVFNPTQSIANSIAMLKIGGRLNLMLPVCGSLDHGMYQFSPNWFYSMHSEWLELEKLYFYINQRKNTHLKIWDGLDEKFKEHVDGTFDGSYLANLLQYTHEPVYSFAVFKKKKEVDLQRFMQDTHQLIYAKYWEEIGRAEVAKRSLSNKTRVFIENKFPQVMKLWIYHTIINSAVISIPKVTPL